MTKESQTLKCPFSAELRVRAVQVGLESATRASMCHSNKPFCRTFLEHIEKFKETQSEEWALEPIKKII